MKLFLAFKVLTAVKRRMGNFNFKLPKLSKPWRSVIQENDSDEDHFLDKSPTPVRPSYYSRLVRKNTVESNKIALKTPPENVSSQQTSNKTTIPLSDGVLRKPNPSRRLTISQDDNEISSILKRGNRSDSSVSSRSGTPLISRPMTPDMRRVLQDSSIGSLQSRPGTPFAVGMSDRVQCLGTTAKGQQCKNAAMPGDYTCRFHS